MGGEKASEREYRLGIISSGCLHLPEPVHAYFVQCVCTHTHTHTCRVKWGMAEVGRKFMEKCGGLGDNEGRPKDRSSS